MIDDTLLAILVCPRSGGALEYNSDTNTLDCQISGLRYPVVNGIPVLIEEEASLIEGR